MWTDAWVRVDVALIGMAMVAVAAWIIARWRDRPCDCDEE